jgi:predicted O-methyltransferase YrrM
MTNRTIGLDDRLYHYLLDNSLREPEPLARLRAETARLPEARMQIAPEQGQFMALLVRLMGARRALEIGVFTGYSSCCIAAALPADGRLVALDASPQWTAMARQYWEELGVAGRVELRLGMALDSLAALRAEGPAPFDFAFIDADKANDWAYYEHCLALLRPGGLVVVDNALWSGRVVDPEDRSEDTEAIRDFNRRIHGDERVDLSLIPVGDGLVLARKRG